MDLGKYLPTLIFVGIVSIFVYNSIYLYEIGVLNSDLFMLRLLLIGLVTLLFFIAERSLTRYIYGHRTRI